MKYGLRRKGRRWQAYLKQAVFDFGITIPEPEIVRSQATMEIDRKQTIIEPVQHTTIWRWWWRQWWWRCCRWRWLNSHSQKVCFCLNMQLIIHIISDAKRMYTLNNLINKKSKRWMLATTMSLQKRKVIK